MDLSFYLKRLILLISEPEEFVEKIGSRSQSGSGFGFFAFATFVGSLSAACMQVIQSMVGAKPEGQLLWASAVDHSAAALIIGLGGAMLLAMTFHLLVTILGGESTIALASRLSLQIAGVASLLYQPAAVLLESGGGYLIAAGGVYFCYLLGKAASHFTDLEARKMWVIIGILAIGHTRLAMRLGAIDLEDFAGTPQTAEVHALPPAPKKKRATQQSRQEAIQALNDAQRRWLAEGRDRALEDLRKGDYRKALEETDRSLAYFPPGYDDIFEIKRNALQAIIAMKEAAQQTAAQQAAEAQQIAVQQAAAQKAALQQRQAVAPPPPKMLPPVPPSSIAQSVARAAAQAQARSQTQPRAQVRPRPQSNRQPAQVRRVVKPSLKIKPAKRPSKPH